MTTCWADLAVGPTGEPGGSYVGRTFRSAWTQWGELVEAQWQSSKQPVR
jgi:hypothetical protein